MGSYGVLMVGLADTLVMRFDMSWLIHIVLTMVDFNAWLTFKGIETMGSTKTQYFFRIFIQGSLRFDVYIITSINLEV